MKIILIVLAVLIFVVLPIFVIGCCIVAGKSAKIIEGLMDETHEEYGDI